MKTLLSIIVALALLVAFSMPAMAHTPSNTASGTTGAAVANDGMATAGSTLSNMFNDNRAYDSRENTVAIADLVQVSSVSISRDGHHTTGRITVNDDNRHNDLEVDDSIRNFAGIANANLSTGAMNNQAVQNTIAVRVLDIR
jgi:hypothetical protein